MQPLILNSIAKELKDKGIIINIDTVKPYKYQGWMSSVFTAESNIGTLIIHLANLVEEHKLNKVWEKFSGLSALLTAHPEIPTSTIQYVTFLKGKLILVQNFICGNPCGKRILSQGIFSDQWNFEQQDIRKKILITLAHIHNLHLDDFGWPTLKDDALSGGHKTWKEFFKIESPRWIVAVKKKDLGLKNIPIENLETLIKTLVDQIDYAGPSVLVHGDAINPGNIILRENKKIFLIDWEWSIAADPAWEFCDLGWWPWLGKEYLKPYFETANLINEEKKENFLKRVNLYIPFWLLWGACMHTNDEQPEVYLGLRQLLINKL
jgi:thiamine kinase-like enzyme